MRISYDLRSAVVRSDTPLGKLIDDTIPEYRPLVTVADRALRYAQAALGQAEPALVWPSFVDEITPDWLEAEVGTWLSFRENAARAEAAQELEARALTAARSLLETQCASLTGALSGRLADWLARMTEAERKLGVLVSTAGQAIEQNCAGAWKTISDGMTEYEQIRALQLEIYALAHWPFDHTSAGSAVPDEEARTYFHRNLSAIEPKWRQPHVALPWPADPVERIVWCIRHNTGIWCPAPSEVDDAAATVIGDVPKRNGKGERNTVPRKYDGKTLRGPIPVDQSGHGFSTNPPTPPETATQSLVEVGPDLWNTPKAL